jgi:thiol:disulfide interchange protein DsbD
LRRIQLVTDVATVVAGREFTVAILIEPRPGYHTYWRGPGVVGVATNVQWTLPEGFTAEPIEWPLPEKVDMAGIEANGFRRKVHLLTRISVPDRIDLDTITLEARCAWMACSVSCHPGVEDFTLTLPVAPAGKAKADDTELAEIFGRIRSTIPLSPPPNWTVSATVAAPDRIDLDIEVPGFSPEEKPGFAFFCDDMQVDSDQPHQFKWIDRDAGRFRLSFVRPDFAPKAPAAFSGWLRSDMKWPGLDQRWVAISVPWPEGTIDDE